MGAAGRAVWVAAGAALLGSCLSACSDSAESAAVVAADAFYRSVADRDGAAACRVLAPGTRSELVESAHKPCPAAVLAQEIPAVGDAVASRAYGTMAQVRYGEETAFLAEFPDGWRMTAAACTPRAGRPYDCQIQGG